jgi:tetratricopeptide (TPR) repeat protein
MVKTSKIAIVVILAAIIVMAAPVSAAMFHGQSESDRAEKIVELADKAGQKVEDLIALVYANDTILEIIENATLLDELEGNVTLYDEGVANVTAAYDALEAEDYENAVGNATEALSIFREVLGSIHFIMQESGVARGDIMEGQGLLTAMERALERIEKLREILDNIDPEDVSEEDIQEALDLLNEAEAYLNKDAAIQWLLDGNVTETAYNLTQANHLISDAHQILKDLAKEANPRRLNNFLEKMTRTRERLTERLQYAGGEGVDVNGVLNQMGYENMTEFEQALQEMASNAKNADDIKDALKELKELGQTIRGIDKELTQQMHQHGQQSGQGGNGQNSGNSQGHGGNGNNH